MFFQPELNTTSIGVVKAEFSALSSTDVVTNAIMLHNVMDMTDIIENLVVEGYPVTQTHIACLSLYAREHLQRFGKYALKMEEAPEPMKPHALQLMLLMWAAMTFFYTYPSR